MLERLDLGAAREAVEENPRGDEQDRHGNHGAHVFPRRRLVGRAGRVDRSGSRGAQAFGERGGRWARRCGCAARSRLGGEPWLVGQGLGDLLGLVGRHLGAWVGSAECSSIEHEHIQGKYFLSAQLKLEL